jgi:aryl-alcohol dehydrogenase
LTEAAPLGCGMATGAGTVMNALNADVGSGIVVFGAGAVGMAAIMAAKIRRCKTIVVIDLNKERMKLAQELGATQALDGRAADIVDQIKEITGGGADYSVDAVGAVPVIVNAIACTRPGGHSVLLGLDSLGKDIPIRLDLIVFNRKIQGAILGDQVAQLLIPQMVQMNQDGIFPFQKLIRKYKFSEINEAIKDTEAGRVIKPVIVF